MDGCFHGQLATGNRCESALVGHCEPRQCDDFAAEQENLFSDGADEIGDARKRRLWAFSKAGFPADLASRCIKTPRLTSALFYEQCGHLPRNRHAGDLSRVARAAAVLNRLGVGHDQPLYPLALRGGQQWLNELDQLGGRQPRGIARDTLAESGIF